MKKAAKLSLWVVLSASCLSASDKGDRNALQHADPEYPAVAAKNNLHGVVKLRIWVAPDGSVRRVEYIGGHPVLAEAAVKAVKNWKYETAKQETNQIVEVRF